MGVSQPVAAAAIGAGLRLAALPPLALYVHIPWCVRKCPYCDFNSHEWRGGPAEGLPEPAYLEALIADLEAALPQVWGRRVSSIFFGGGTPSLFSGQAIDALLCALRSRLPLDPDAEITLEANPGTVEAGRFAQYRAAGVNRVSLGIQSFETRYLHALGRIHDGQEAQRALEVAQAVFPRVNLDLMYALPGQSPEDALRDIERAVQSGVEHVSAYHLTIEPNTLFHRHRPVLPDEDTAAHIHEAVGEALCGAGFEHYETSAYARPGARCRHNLNYWRFGDYLGIGAGAHSKLSFPDRIVRASRIRNPRDYMAKALEQRAVAEEQPIARGELPFEFMMNALRLAEGFETALFTARTGLPISVAQAALAKAEARGLIERDPVRVRPSALGRRFLNDLLELFLP